MTIEFYKSNLKKITKKYIELYKRCFKKYPLNKNYQYFEWLYKKNPSGEFIGIGLDTEKGIEIGQVGGVPYNFNYSGINIKILQSINVCVDKNYREKTFKLMASKLEAYAKEQNYSLIIAIANAQVVGSAWINSISMKFLSKLDVFLTYNIRDREIFNIK